MEAQTGITDRPRRDAQTALYGLLAIMAFLGWEWLNSGLSKLIRGNFASGLPDQLHTQSQAAPSWYRDLIHDTVIPNHNFYAGLIEFGEIAVGLAFIGAAGIWLMRGQVLGDLARSIVLSIVLLAGLAATVMNVNFHLAGGGHHPWFFAKDAFGEGVDLDSLLPMLQLTIVAVSGKLLVDTRRDHRAKTSAGPVETSPVGERVRPATAATTNGGARAKAAPKSLPSVSAK